MDESLDSEVSVQIRRVKLMNRTVCRTDPNGFRFAVETKHITKKRFALLRRCFV